MTELAPIFGIEPGTVWVGIGSSSSRCFVVARCVRRGRGVALEFASESEFAVAADFAFERCLCGTPVGRTSFGFSSPGGAVVGSAARHRAARPTAQQANPTRYQRFMGGKLAIKIQRVQAVATNPRRAGLARFRTLPE